MLQGASIMKMKSAYLLTFVVQNNYNVLCIRSCKWFQWAVCPLWKKFWSLFCYFLSLLLHYFVNSFLHLVENQNVWYKVQYVLSEVGWRNAVGTVYWMVCFTIKKEKWPVVDFLFSWWGQTGCVLSSHLIIYFMNKLFLQWSSMFEIPNASHNKNALKPFCSWRETGTLNTLGTLIQLWTMNRKTDHVA